MIDNRFDFKDSFTSRLILGFPFSFPKENTSYNYSSNELGYVALTSNPKISVAQKKKSRRILHSCYPSAAESTESALCCLHSEYWLIDQLFEITLARGKDGVTNHSPALVVST